MLMVAPMGSTNLEILGSTPFFSSRQFMVTGSVAELEAVPQAVVMAPNMFFMNLKGSFRVKMVKMSGSTRKPWMARPSRTVRKYQASFRNSAARSLFSSSWPATRKQTPRGARWMIQVVIFIITILTLSKNFRRGAPSSPQAAMAIPSSYTDENS